MAGAAPILSGHLLACAVATWISTASSFVHARGALRHMPPASQAMLRRSFAAMAAFIAFAVGAALLMALRASS